MGEDSLLSDDLLRQLVGVGHVDVVVGVPTLNHASTIARLVQAVHAGFRAYFPRQRTVIVNSDGGSHDSTAQIVRECCTDAADTVTASHRGLRTTHRISAFYNGMPGRKNAWRLILTAADLLQASAVIILDPDVTNVTPEWVAALGRPVRDQQFDFVAPLYQREPADGLLVTQLLRPLFGATIGCRLHEPLTGEFGCSARFVTHCTGHAPWDAGESPNELDLWISAAAAAGRFNLCQVRLGSRVLAADRPRAELRDLFTQVVGAAFRAIEAHAEAWLGKTATDEVAVFGDFRSGLGQPSGPPPDGARLMKSFARDVVNLTEILRAILRPETLSAVRTVAEGGTGRQYPDSLWAETVTQFLLAHQHGVMRREHVIQALLPLYLGRAGAFLSEHATDSTDVVQQAFEALCLAFEQTKPRLVEAWAAGARSKSTERSKAADVRGREEIGNRGTQSA